MRTTWRDNILMLVSTFAVTNVRHLIQYNKYAWSQGVLALLVSLFVHFIVIFFSCAIVSYIVSRVDKEEERDDLAKTIRYVFATVLILSIAIYTLYLLKGGPLIDEQEHEIWGSLSVLAGQGKSLLS
jgi:hypothetical protein